MCTNLLRCAIATWLTPSFQTPVIIKKIAPNLFHCILPYLEIIKRPLALQQRPLKDLQRFIRAVVYLLKVNNRNTSTMWNLFKVNHKDTRTTSLTSFWRIYCKLWTNKRYKIAGEILGSSFSFTEHRESLETNGLISSNRHFLNIPTVIFLLYFGTILMIFRK